MRDVITLMILSRADSGGSENAFLRKGCLNRDLQNEWDISRLKGLEVEERVGLKL